jgi:hypothetical protein
MTNFSDAQIEIFKIYKLFQTAHSISSEMIPPKSPYSEKSELIGTFTLSVQINHAMGMATINDFWF